MSKSTKNRRKNHIEHVLVIVCYFSDVIRTIFTTLHDENSFYQLETTKIFDKSWQLMKISKSFQNRSKTLQLDLPQTSLKWSKNYVSSSVLLAFPTLFWFSWIFRPKNPKKSGFWVIFEPWKFPKSLWNSKNRQPGV